MGFALTVIIYLGLLSALTFRRVELALAILIAILPAYGVRFSILGVPATLLEASIWVVAVTWFVKMWRLHGRPRLPTLAVATSERNPFQPFVWPLLLWLLVAAVAATISPRPMAALGLWKAYFIEPLMVFVIIVLTLRRRPERWWIMYALGATVVAISILAWYQHFTGNLLPVPWNTNQPLRVTSFFSYPNAIGLFLAPVLAMYVALLLEGIKGWRNVRQHIWALLVVVLGVGAILFSVTKGAWIGVAVGSLVAAAIAFAEHRRRLAVIGIILIFALTALAPVAGATFLNEVTLKSPSGAVRLAIWEETITFLKDHPLTGAGLAGYQTAIEPYHQWWRSDVSPYKLEIFLYPHNIFLNVWVELGLAGLIVFCWIIILFFRLTWRQRHQPLSAAALAGMVALLVHGFVDVPYFKNDLAVLFWIIVALPLLDRKSVHVFEFPPHEFAMLKSGVKTFTTHLGTKLYRAVEAGDIIVCHQGDAGYECLRLEVVEVMGCPTFSSLIEVVHPLDLGYENTGHAYTAFRGQYSEQHERRHGVVGFRLRLISS